MIFRRRSTAEEPPWRARVGEARALVNRHRPDPLVAVQLDRVEAALDQSVADGAAIREALDSLGAERASAELKAALRARPDPTAADTPQIRTLRRRHEAVHELQNALADLDRRVSTTVADLEAYAAGVVAASVRATSAGRGDAELDALLESLHLHAAALAAAHDELDQLTP